MPDERKLELNSLARYAKRSPGLVLEEHSHCEVPAGCGGVVLRWTNPERELLATLRVFSRANPKVSLDGAPVASPRVNITVGSHAFGVRLESTQANLVAVLFAATYDESGYTPQRSRKTGATFSIVSAADGLWRATDRDPGEGWDTPGFDDGAWPPAVARATSAPGEKDGSVYRYREVVKLGARSIGLAGGARVVWLRRRFELAPPPPPPPARDDRRGP